MPCTCYGYPEPLGLEHNGPAAEALCKTLQEHEERGEMSCFNESTLLWWTRHKERDQARLAQDLQVSLRAGEMKAALAKLTPYERRLLGVW